MISDRRIDDGTPFDWGRTSSDYAKYRDIYPPEFYRMVLDRGLCRDGQHVLDLGTGTGVLSLLAGELYNWTVLVSVSSGVMWI